MGSDPQYVKYPDLALSQDIFNLSNPACAQTVREGSLKKLQKTIKDSQMAPLYRHLAHPTEGILNSSGESSQQPSAGANNSNKPTITSDILPNKRQSLDLELPWDEKLYESLLAENNKELETLQKEEDEAGEAAGETEVQAARGKRAEFYARVGDKVRTRNTAV